MAELLIGTCCTTGTVGRGREGELRVLDVGKDFVELLHEWLAILLDVGNELFVDFQDGRLGHLLGMLDVEQGR